MEPKRFDALGRASASQRRKQNDALRVGSDALTLAEEVNHLDSRHLLWHWLRGIRAGRNVFDLPNDMINSLLLTLTMTTITITNYQVQWCCSHLRSFDDLIDLINTFQYVSDKQTNIEETLPNHRIQCSWICYAHHPPEICLSFSCFNFFGSNYK